MKLKFHRELLAELPKGSRIDFLKTDKGGGSVRVKKRGRHPSIILPDGRTLRDERGMPICVSMSPSDNRTMMNERARIRRALRALDA